MCETFLECNYYLFACLVSVMMKVHWIGPRKANSLVNNLKHFYLRFIWPLKTVHMHWFTYLAVCVHFKKDSEHLSS